MLQAQHGRYSKFISQNKIITFTVHFENVYVIVRLLHNFAVKDRILKLLRYYTIQSPTVYMVMINEMAARQQECAPEPTIRESKDMYCSR